MANEITQKIFEVNSWTVWQVTGRIDVATSEDTYSK